MTKSPGLQYKDSGLKQSCQIQSLLMSFQRCPNIPEKNIKGHLYVAQGVEKGKFVVINSCNKKGIYEINNVKLYLKKLEKEQTKPKGQRNTLKTKKIWSKDTNKYINK